LSQQYPIVLRRLKMSKFQLFDGVRLREDLPLIDGGIAPIGTVGTIVEILKNGEAYHSRIIWRLG
jgi:hypothetical protein